MGRAKRPKVERLGEKLAEIRRAQGLSQGELIKKLGLDGVIYQANISEYESGRREPPLPILLKYARLAGISTDNLIDDKLDLRWYFTRSKSYALRLWDRWFDLCYYFSRHPCPSTKTRE